MVASGSLTDRTAPVARAPRPMAWVVVLASGAAVLVAGLAATLTIVSGVHPKASDVPAAFWRWVVLAAALTAASLGVRAIRWVFLLRRANVRIPIRDALIGYFAGLSLMLVPLLVGEIAVRAYVLRARAAAPVANTTVVTLWERLLDLFALAILAGVTWTVFGGGDWYAAGLILFVACGLLRSMRELALAPAVAAGNVAARVAPGSEPRVRVADVSRLAAHHTWLFASAASVAAWLLPAVALRGLVGAWGHQFSAAEAIDAYASTTLQGVFALAPGGVLVVGRHLLSIAGGAGLDSVQAATTVFAIRAATVGVAVALGGIFVLVHLRSRAAAPQSHFDEIAHAYDAQIPEERRQTLLTRKTEMMHRVLAARGGFRRGLDVGCGQGWYVKRMRTLGYDVDGIDPSAGQLDKARLLLGGVHAVYAGSALRIPAEDASFDFVYTINVLHHLGSIDEQRAALAEIERVLRPGGLIFLHEINTRNPLFRFYMGYVFPSLNCIDEGIERWLPPNALATYTGATELGVEYFTFLPDFMPAPLVRLLRPLERLLEALPLRAYSAHYMAVLQKPA